MVFRIKLRLSLLLLSLLISIVALPGAAQAVPQLINYQGYLGDSNGDPVNGTVGMTFTLYDDAASGTALWSDIHHTVTVTDGRRRG